MLKTLVCCHDRCLVVMVTVLLVIEGSDVTGVVSSSSVIYMYHIPERFWYTLQSSLTHLGGYIRIFYSLRDYGSPMEKI